MNGTMNARTLRTATILTAMAISATLAAEKSRNPDCIALDQAQAQKGQLMEQANKLNDQGRSSSARRCPDRARTSA